MRYGYFDQQKREYVINCIDVPVSWTNYLGVEDLCAVVNHTAGGSLFYKSPEHHRITRFRPNGVPMDRPGHYIYLRDDRTGEYWSFSWQPCGERGRGAAASGQSGIGETGSRETVALARRRFLLFTVTVAANRPTGKDP